MESENGSAFVPQKLWIAKRDLVFVPQKFGEQKMVLFWFPKSLESKNGSVIVP
jgi:hypothetical protein